MKPTIETNLPRRQTPAPGRHAAFKQTSHDSNPRPQTTVRRRLLPRFLSKRTRGQALLIVALAMTVIVLFVGLGVDVAFLMAKRSKLQSAVDSAALSAAQILYASTETNARLKAYQILEASGVPSTTLATDTGGTNPEVGFPGVGQVSVNAVQKVDTFFMRLIPLWSTINIDAFAIADATSYAEIQAKPYGDPGVVSELNLMVWGKWSRRSNGDNYSPYYIPSSQSAPIRNTEYDKQPDGYLFRIDVPADYPANKPLVVQVFDADSYNRPQSVPTPNATRAPGAPVVVTPTPSPDQYAYCAVYNDDNCTTTDVQQETGVKLNAFPNGLPAFWRVDEIRAPYYATDNSYDSSKTTKTRYSLWHFNRRNTTAFGDPRDLTDYAPGGVPGPIASIEVKDDLQYDLRWQQVFTIPNLSNYEKETNGKYYFYLYVQGVDGSSENNYDLRVGPNSSCTDLDSTPYNSPCYVNNIYWNAWKNGQEPSTLWDDGGAKIFAKRALPLNLDTGASFPIVLAQINKNAGGQTLGVRHFDQDCNGGCGKVMTYQMQLCGSTDLSVESSWGNIGTGTGIGYVGPDNGWNAPGTIPGTNPAQSYPDPEPVKIPVEGSQKFKDFFGPTGSGLTCDSSWLRIQTNPSYSTDTTVWELPFLRPRLVQ